MARIPRSDAIDLGRSGTNTGSCFLEHFGRKGLGRRLSARCPGGHAAFVAHLRLDPAGGRAHPDGIRFLATGVLPPRENAGTDTPEILR